MQREEEEEEKKRVWWVKDREILNHTVILEDLSIPHMYLGAQGFRHMHALQAETGTHAYFLLPASKNIFKGGCFFFPVFQSPLLRLTYIGTHTCTMRLLIHWKPRERRQLQTLPPTVFYVHCSPAAQALSPVQDATSTATRRHILQQHPHWLRAHVQAERHYWTFA